MKSKDNNDIKGDAGIDGIQKAIIEIEEIDETLLSLINRRLLISKRLGKSDDQSHHQNMPAITQYSVIERLVQMNQGPVTSEVLRQVFTEIYSACRDIQLPAVVSYLGPEATFTHMAALKHFGHSSRLMPQPAIRDIFFETEKGNSQFGVVPVENSIEGAVNYTLDLFFESELKICGELYLPIFHLLMSNEEALNQIKVVYSHPQAFAQCRAWLRHHLPHAALEHCNSTADAARLASSQPASAAVAGKEAAGLYKLGVLASGIEDIPNNVTRFLVIGDKKNPVTGNDKTTLLFVTGHVPGALYNVLSPLAIAGVNMLKLESRPVKHQSWSYFFFVDFDGHINDPHVKDTIKQMEKQCMYLKWLGSYPKGMKR